MNDRISRQRELIAKKEGKFYQNKQDFQDRINTLPFEVGQNVWLQNSDSRKCEEAVIRDACREPNSYMVEIPANWTVLQEKQQLHQAKAERREFQFYRPSAEYQTPRDSRGIPSSSTILHPKTSSS